MAESSRERTLVGPSGDRARPVQPRQNEQDHPEKRSREKESCFPPINNPPRSTPSSSPGRIISFRDSPQLSSPSLLFSHSLLSFFVLFPFQYVQNRPQQTRCDGPSGCDGKGQPDGYTGNHLRLTCGLYRNPPSRLVSVSSRETCPSTSTFPPTSSSRSVHPGIRRIPISSTSLIEDYSMALVCPRVRSLAPLRKLRPSPSLSVYLTPSANTGSRGAKSDPTR